MEEPSLRVSEYCKICHLPLSLDMNGKPSCCLNCLNKLNKQNVDKIFEFDIDNLFDFEENE